MQKISKCLRHLFVLFFYHTHREKKTGGLRKTHTYACLVLSALHFVFIRSGVENVGIFSSLQSRVFQTPTNN